MLQAAVYSSSQGWMQKMWNWQNKVKVVSTCINISVTPGGRSQIAHGSASMEYVFTIVSMVLSEWS